MLENTIKNFFFIITAFYTYYKLLNSKPKNRYLYSISLILSILVSILVAYLYDRIHVFGWAILFILFFLIVYSTERYHFSTMYMTALFSYAFSFIVFSMSIILVSLISAPFYYNSYNIPWPILRTCIGMLQFLLIYCCFHIPRLQKGMIFLYHIPSGNTGSTLCIVLLMLIILFGEIRTDIDFLMFIVFSLILISAFLLIYWWNYHITQTYKKYLKRNEINFLNLLIEEQNQQIAYLKNEHDKLARIIHKDNKLIPAITMAIIDSKENSTELNLPELDTDSDLTLKLK